MTWASIGIALAAAVAADALIKPREQFISSPFAVPILIAANRFSAKGISLTAAVTLVAATIAARLSRSAFAPTVFHLVGLGIISALSYLWGRQRLATAQHALEAGVERTRLDTILRSTASAILYVDAQTGRIAANPAAADLFGNAFPRDASRARYAAQFHTPDGRRMTEKDLPLSGALQGQTLPQKELVIVRPDGSQTPVLSTASPVRDSSGNVIGAVAAFQDISTLKELERVRSEWTSMIAHDLRQPITVITAYADRLQTLLANHGGPEEQKAVEHVLSSAATLNQMIADLLDVSRVEARQLALRPQPTDLPSLVRSVVERSGRMLRHHPVRVTVQGSVLPLEIDPVRIEQVLSNLLSNAAKYGYPNTEIQVEIERRGQVVEVSVANQGEGIPPDELPRIFERFYRTAQARTGPVAGIGLGLTIAKGLVEAHGGRMWAESIPSQTTTFHFALPVVASTGKENSSPTG
jgi:PAS domain S-box-containing protein